MNAKSYRSLFPALLGDRIQLGVVVKDLDAALAFWTQKLKLGPFVVIENPAGGWVFRHRGQVQDISMSVAFTYIGETMVELLAQNNSVPSPYTEFFAGGREGVQHIAFWPDDFDAACLELERGGFSEVSTIHVGEEKTVAYYEGPPHFGVMAEIVRMTPARVKYYRGIRALAETWDGTRPVRRFATYADYMESDDCLQ
ncbi:MAG: VOC family protein [Reyranellaceae bacterium]